MAKEKGDDRFYDDDDGRLTLLIDRRWSASEFSDLFAALSGLHDFEALCAFYLRWRDLKFEELAPRFDRRFSSLGWFDLDDDYWLRSPISGRRGPGYRIPSDSVRSMTAYIAATGSYNITGHRLDVQSIQYASPGEINLKGSGEILKEVRKL